MTMGLSRSCIMLIVLAGKERFAFKGVASNLVTYLTDVVKMTNSSAAKTVNTWCGFTSMLPLLLAPIADSYWDRYSTILAFSFIYVLGLVALTSTAFSWAWTNSASSNFLFWSLCLISIGQGGYNPSLQAFGADELDSDEELPTSQENQNKKSNKNSLFFKWWYFGVCTGSLLGVTLMSYIQDSFGWVLGFAIPTLAMVTSTAFFSFGSQIFKFKSDETIKDKPLMTIVQSIRAAATKLLKNKKIVLQIEKSDAMELELQEQPLCCDQNSGSRKEFDDDLNPKNGNHLVVLRLLPIWTMLLMFAVIFQQPATFFTKQGMTMKRNMGGINFKIPPATLQSAITVSIILLMPLYDTIFIRIIHAITCREKGITVMQRMGIGMFLSIIAMVIAAIVETKRLAMNQQYSETVPLSIFWLLPQYILLGISDIFTVVGMQEFFFKEVPMRMRTMGFALYTSVFGVGSFLSALLISVIEVLTTSINGHSWFSDDMREARLDLYYWVLAIASALSLLFYVILCKFFSSRSDLDNETCK